MMVSYAFLQQALEIPEGVTLLRVTPSDNPEQCEFVLEGSVLPPCTSWSDGDELPVVQAVFERVPAHTTAIFRTVPSTI